MKHLTLTELVAEKLDKPQSKVWFTSLDMQYAYG